MIPKSVRVEVLPEGPGVYLMRGARGAILYIGTAVNVRRRVTGYFTRPANDRIKEMVRGIRRIDVEEAGSALEALILESLLIKKHKPPYNILQKDDRSFLYVEITRDEFPVVRPVRGKNTPCGTRYGPFPSARQLQEALKVLRRIFPFNVHPRERIGAFTRPCLEMEVGLCPGTCVGAISKSEYRKTIRNLKYFFEGKRSRLMKTLEKEMRAASKNQKYEKAESLKRQLFALRHVNDVALISDDKIQDTRNKIQTYRIEGYDVSNIGGESAVGSMVVFEDGSPNKNEYRKFKIKTVKGSNDAAMLREVLERRLQHNEWQMPDLILIDGGKGQVSATQNVLHTYGLRVPVVGIAKGPDRRKNEFVGVIPRDVNPDTLIAVRDEAHRFAQGYHRTLRSRQFLA